MLERWPGRPFERENLQALCARCHNSKDQAGALRGVGGVEIARRARHGPSGHRARAMTRFPDDFGWLLGWGSPKRVGVIADPVTKRPRWRSDDVGHG